MGSRMRIVCAVESDWWINDLAVELCTGSDGMSSEWAGAESGLWALVIAWSLLGVMGDAEDGIGEEALGTGFVADVANVENAAVVRSEEKVGETSGTCKYPGNSMSRLPFGCGKLVSSVVRGLI